MSWSRAFEDPIPLPRGRHLITLKDAGAYIMKLPKARKSSVRDAASLKIGHELKLVGGNFFVRRDHATVFFVQAENISGPMYFFISGRPVGKANNDNRLHNPYEAKKFGRFLEFIFGHRDRERARDATLELSEDSEHLEHSLAGRGRSVYPN